MDPRTLRFGAALLRAHAARLDMAAAAAEAADSLRAFTQAVTESDQATLMDHPDLADLRSTGWDATM